MQIFVKAIDGRTVTVTAEPFDNVAVIEQQVSERTGLAGNLRFGGRTLDSAETLSLYGICNLSTLDLNCDLLGGKKRKKKNYTTPKKIKHKKKKVKLAVLKYYKVDGSGKISRLRKECPSKECGAGVFMAQHANRTYCGKCHLTYMVDKAGAQE